MAFQCGVSCNDHETWQKRGHSSMNGYVTTLSMDTGKCLNIQVLRKVCHGKPTGHRRKKSIASRACREV